MKKLLLSLFILSYHSLLLSSQDPLLTSLPEGLFSSTVSQDPLFSSSQNPLASSPESLLTSSSENPSFILPSENPQQPIPHQTLLPPFFNDQQESPSPKYITYMKRLIVISTRQILPIREEFIFFNNHTFTSKEITALSKAAISFKKPSIHCYHGTFEEKKEQLADLLKSYTHKEETFVTFKITQLPFHIYKIEIFNQNNEMIKTTLVSGD